MRAVDSPYWLAYAVDPRHASLQLKIDAAATLSRPLAYCYAANLDSNPFDSRVPEYGTVLVHGFR